jgi:mono/diheme cytochrome c family protein
MTSRPDRSVGALLAAAGFIAVFLAAADVRVLTQESTSAEQAGRKVYAQHCETCHGADRSGVTSPNEIGVERFKSAVREGTGQMPGYPETMITDDQLDALVAYVLNPSAGVPKVGAGATSASPQERRGNGKGARPCSSVSASRATLRPSSTRSNTSVRSGQRVVEDMKSRGVEGTEQELQTLVDFLARADPSLHNQ